MDVTDAEPPTSSEETPGTGVALPHVSRFSFTTKACSPAFVECVPPALQLPTELHAIALTDEICPGTLTVAIGSGRRSPHVLAACATAAGMKARATSET